MKLKITALFLLACLSSCSFNKSFYQAEKLPPGIKKAFMNVTVNGVTYKYNIVNFGANFQPTFTDTLNNVLAADYTIESVVFKNNKGKNLNGWFIKGKDKPKADITLLLLHGNGGNLLSHYAGASELAEKGFQVFIFDYSGYGFSEGKATRMNVLHDADAALDYIRSRDDVKNTKIVIYGQSLGGHLAATVARDNEALVDGLVIEGGFSSHKDIAAHMFKPIALLARILVKEKYKAYKSIEDFHKPVLAIYSSEDAIVPMWMGEKIYRHAHTPKSFYAIKYPHISGPEFYADSITYKIRTMTGK